MHEEGPSYSSVKKKLARGAKVELHDGPGIFLEYAKGNSELCTVLVGGYDGMKRGGVSVPAVIEATFGVVKRMK